MRRASELPPDTAADRKTATRADLLDAVYSSCPALSRAQAKQIFEMTLEEITDALVEDMKANVWVLNRVTFTGAAVLRRDKAAYRSTWIELSK